MIKFFAALIISATNAEGYEFREIDVDNIETNTVSSEEVG